MASASVETIGVSAIPEAQRSMPPATLFTIWGLASASATTPVIGLLLYDLGVLNFCIAVVLATLVGIVPAAILSEQGREVPLISMITARATFGRGGAFVLAFIYTLTGAGWFGLNTDVGGQILSTLYPGYGSLWYWLLGIGQTLLVFAGMKWLEWFYKYTALIFIVCYVVLTYYMVSRYDFSLPSGDGPVAWGTTIDLILSFSLLAWAYEFSTVSRFCRPATANESRSSRVSYFAAATLGVMAPVLVMGLLGLVAKASTGEWNIALIAKDLPLTGALAALGVILAIAHTNAMNLYPAVLKLLAAGETVRQPRRFDQPVAALALGLTATILAVSNILSYVEPFLLFIGSFLFPFSFLMAFDWVVVQKRRTSVAEFFAPADGLADLFRVRALTALIFGILVSSLDPLGWIPAWVTAWLPWSVVASLLACALYAVLLRFEAARQQSQQTA
ncbi:cytosine permease [Salinisphaera sp. SPP-AMP-43]|uniref:purine-cytosine permease family protein n=1 Tax=Salinisphaera sp. SPP-AMP-43 TaxID=3121288 RepID=UPI003C6E9F95